MADCEVPTIAASRAWVTWTRCLSWRMMFTTKNISHRIYFRHFHGTNAYGSASDRQRLLQGRRAGPGRGRGRRHRPWGTSMGQTLTGAPATGSGCCRDDELGRAAGGAEGTDRGALPWDKRLRERQRPAAVVAGTTSWAGPRAGPKAPTVGHFHDRRRGWGGEPARRGASRKAIVSTRPPRRGYHPATGAA